MKKMHIRIFLPILIVLLVFLRARLFTEQFTGWDCLFTMGRP